MTDFEGISREPSMIVPRPTPDPLALKDPSNWRDNSWQDGNALAETANSRTALPPKPEAIRNALARVLKSQEFSSVGQLRAFLAYVVGASLDNRAHELKGYTIAVEALGRDETFDPVTNPIVRVEAARLRRRLNAYYTTCGASDPVWILIPKGTYAPVFIPRPQSTELMPSGSAPGPAKEPSRAAAYTASRHPGQVSSQQERMALPLPLALTPTLRGLRDSEYLLNPTAIFAGLVLAFAAGWLTATL